MSCKCPKSWCYHRPDCIRGPLVETIVEFEGAAPWRGEVDRRQAISPAPSSPVKADDNDEAPALPSNGPQAARLENLLQRQAEIIDALAKTPNPLPSLIRAGELIAAAIDRVRHEGTPIDWRKAS